MPNTATVPATAPASTPEAPATSGATTVAVSPVIESPKKKKKRKYSRGLGDLQRLDLAMAKASRRISRAVADGLATYVKESNKSARKRRDGALEDALENWAAAVGKTLRGASSAPEVFASTISTRRSRKDFRRMVRLTAFPLFIR